jgi:hypothetical protein
VQIFDKDEKKIYTTILAIPDQRLEPSDKPVVLFSERTAGTPQAIKAWFYPGETIGNEFVYPKSQAITIAKATHQTVLAAADDTTTTSDAMKSAQIGRVDESGQMSNSSGAARGHHVGRRRPNTSGRNGGCAPAAPRATTARTDASAYGEQSADGCAPQRFRCIAAGLVARRARRRLMDRRVTVRWAGWLDRREGDEAKTEPSVQISESVRRVRASCLSLHSFLPFLPFPPSKSPVPPRRIL